MTTQNAQTGMNVIERMATEDRQREERAAFYAVNEPKTPIVIARSRQMASALGLPPAVVANDFDNYDRWFKQQSITNRLQLNPALAAPVLRDPVFAAMARDEIDKFDKASVITWKFVKSTPRALVSGPVSQAGGAVYGGLRAASENLAPALDPIVGRLLPENPLRRLAAFAKKGQEASEALAKTWRPEVENSTQVGIVSGIESFGTTLLTLPFAMARLSAGGAGAVRQASLAVSAPMAAGVAGNEYAEARKEGLSPFRALAFAATQGGIELATEAAPTTALLKDVVKRTGLARTAGGFVGREVVGEQIATLGQDFNQWLTLNPSKTLSEFIAERPDAAYQTLIATLVGAGGTVATTKIAEKVARSLTNNIDELRLAEHNNATVAAMLEAARDIALRKAAPDSFAAFMQAAIESAPDPVESVYIDAQRLGEIVAGSGLTEAEIEQILPGVTAQIDEAATTGGAVEIPLAQLAATLPGSAIEQQVLDNLRVGESGLSAAESREKAEQAEQWFGQLVADAAASAEDAINFEASAGRVSDIIAGQLRAGRQFSDDQVSAYATLAKAFYSTMARREGMSPEQFYERHPLAIGFRETETSGTPLTQRPLDEAFRNWFGNSAAVDASGAPRVVFHGNASDFDAFDGSAAGSTTQAANARLGFFFTDRPGIAATYARMAGQRGDGSGQNITPAYLSLQNPLRATAANMKEADEILLRDLQSDNDGAIIEVGEGERRQTVYMVRRPEQAKSIFNEVAFDPADSNMLRQTVRRERPVSKAVAEAASITNARAVAKAQKWRTIRDFKIALQNAVRAAARSRDLREDTPENRAYITRQLLAEARTALAENANAVGWYDEKVSIALEVLATIHPEIKTDEQAKFAFVWALAVTSNGVEVSKNFELAEKAYRHWKNNNGRMPTSGIGVGTAAGKINDGLKTYNLLTERWGFARTREFATALQPNRGVKAVFGRAVSGEGLDTLVYGAGILGPKIGNGFFMNLYGEFGQLTMDRWWVRMWGRLTGDLVDINPAATREARDAFLKVIDIIRADREALRAVEAALQPKAKKGQKVTPFRLSKSTPAETAVAIVRATTKEKVRDALAQILPATAEREAAVLAARGQVKDFVSVGDELRKAAKAYYSRLDGQIETPGGSQRRDMMRAISSEVLAELQRENPLLTMADFQALMWYPEKFVYESAGAEEQDVDDEDGYSDDGAPDYANAAVKLAKDQGVSDADIDAAIGRARSDIEARQRAGRSGRSTVGVSGAGGNGAGADPGVLLQAGVTEDGRDGTGRYSSRGLAPLEGAPVIQGATGPDPSLVAVAEQYARERGINLVRQAEYARVDENFARAVALAYDEMQHAPNDPAVREAYADLIRQTRDQYDALVAAGYSFTFFDSNTDPYDGNPWNAMRDLRANKTMAVYGTYDGFGTDGVTEEAIDNNPMLADTGLRWPDQNGVMRPVTANDLFRAVHDAFGHGLEGAGFRAQGEENAWQAHVRLFTGPAVAAITTETRGQNSWLNYGPYGDQNRNAKVEDTVFAPQKTGLMPSWTWEQNRVPDAEVDALNQIALSKAVAGFDPRTDFAQQTPDTGLTLTGIHFSQQRREVLDGVFYGTGINGAEFERVNAAPDRRLRDRVYFYIDEGKGVRPEAGVGAVAHEAVLTRIYDPASDPLGLWDAGGSLSDKESRILDAGFSGYYYRNAWSGHGVAVVIGPASHGIHVKVTTASIQQPSQPAPPAEYRRALLGREMRALEPVMSAMPAGTQIDATGTLRVPKADLPAARAVASGVGVSLPQGGDRVVRGTYTPSTRTINLLKDADLSTFLHELGHFFLDTTMRVAADPASSQQTKDDAAILLKWFGITGNEAVGGPSADGDLEQRVFHGTPHRGISRFSTEFIGAGEGAQAYGWGLYFASEKEIAEWYRNALSSGYAPTIVKDDVELSAAADIAEVYYRVGRLFKSYSGNEVVLDFDKQDEDRWWVKVQEADSDGKPKYGARPRWHSTMPDFSDLERVLKREGYDVRRGQLYEVEIPEDSEMLLWDKPLSQQPEAVRSALAQLGFRTEGNRGSFFYQRLSDMNGGDKAASEALAALGVKGIKYLDGTSRADGDGTFNYVVFSGDDTAIVNQFYQGGEPTTPGALPAGRTPLEVWNSMTLEQQRPYHERFAEAFEQYLFEGKAPSKELRGPFERFAQFLRSAYQSLQSFLRGRNLDLTPEVRRVMDRMLASQEAIEEAESLNAMAALFETKPPTMSEDDWEAYQRNARAATEEAISRLQSRSLRDLRWVQREVERESRRISKELKAARAEMRERAKAEVEQDRPFAAMRWIREGLLPDGTKTVGAKISEESLIARFGDEANAKWRYLPADLVAKDGLPFDAVAEIISSNLPEGQQPYANGEQMLDELIQFQDVEMQTENLTDLYMLEEYGDLTTPDGVERAAQEAVYNEARGRFFADEVRALAEAMNVRAPTARSDSRGRPMTTNAIMEAARDYAKKVVAGKTLRSLKSASHQYKLAAARAGRESIEASGKGDIETAIVKKRQQLLNHELARFADRGADEIRTAFKKFKSDLFKADSKIANSRDMNIVNAARSILARYGFTQNEKTPEDYLKSLRAYDPELAADIEMHLDALPAARPDYRDMTVAEVTDVIDRVQALWAMSRRAKTMQIAGERVEIESVAAQLASVLANEKPFDRGTVAGENVKLERSLRLSGIKASLRRMESWSRAMDGGQPGLFTKYIWQPISGAVVEYRNARNDFVGRYIKLLRAIEKDVGKPGIIAAPELKPGFAFSDRAALLHAVLHTGNISNKRKLLLGYGIATEDANGTLDTSAWDAFIERMHDEGVLTKQHWDFAQSVWDLLEEMKPKAQRAHYEMYGRYFDEVTANEITNRFGTYRGGYVPAITDPKFVDEKRTQDAVEDLTQQQNALMFPSVGRGFTKSRIEDYTRQLQLDLRLLGNHIDKVARFTHLGPAVRDVARLTTRNKTFVEAISAVDPTAIEAAIRPWLERTAQQSLTVPPRTWAGRFASEVASTLRSRTSTTLMMANLVNVLQQTTGLTVAALRVKPRYLASALADYMRGPNVIAKQTNDLSPWLKQRTENQSFEMVTELEEILLNPSPVGRVKDWTNRNAYFLQQAYQNMLDRVVWTGAYQQALAEGLSSDDAVLRADGVVRETQGSFAPEDSSAIEKQNAFVRLFLQFFSYFNAQANLLGAEFKTAMKQTGATQKTMRVAYLYAMGFALPAFLAEVISQGLKGELGEDDDDDDPLWKELMTLFGTSQLKYGAAMVPGVGPVTTVTLNAFATDTPADDRLSVSPVFSLLESAARAPVSVYDAFFNDGSVKRAVRDTMVLFALASGMPIGPAIRPVSYTVDVLSGEAEPTGPVDLTRGILTGK